MILEKVLLGCLNVRSICNTMKTDFQGYDLNMFTGVI
jgi:hypothetical protein